MFPNIPLILQRNNIQLMGLRNRNSRQQSFTEKTPEDVILD